MPVARCAASVQSYRSLMPAHLSTHLSASLAGARPHGRAGIGTRVLGAGTPLRPLRDLRGFRPGACGRIAPPGSMRSGPLQCRRHYVALPCRAVEPGRDETVPPGQVLVVAGIPPAPFLGEDPVDRRALRCAMLDRDQPEIGRA